MGLLDPIGKIILDLPPLLAVADSEVGAAASDLVLFLSHWGRTPPEATRSAIERLRRFGVAEIRAVLSGSPRLLVQGIRDGPPRSR